MEQKPVKVAVIGAGMAGLIAARELRRENHDVVIFEKSSCIGGTWVYDPKVETDPLGLDPTREIVHSSMYDSLRVNLPRHLMGFSDYPFTPREGGDPRTFPGREEVLRFLNDFANDFELIGLVRFNCDVVRVEVVGPGSIGSGQWAVEWKNQGQAGSNLEVFEAVMVCTGQNTQPRIAEFPGRSSWPGKQVHSHNYRTPEPYKDQIVVVIGCGPSALDISADILPVAKEVHQASRGENVEFRLKNSVACQHPMIKCAQEDGKIVFEDGSSVYADVILHCTGYGFHFPFLRTDGIVTVDGNRVGPLYKHVFPPSLAPGLSFIGLTTLAVTTLVVEMQSKWVARVLSGKMSLPSEEQMMLSVQEYYKQLEEKGWPKHHTHRLQLEKFGYENWLADVLGQPPLEKWIEAMFFNLFTLHAKYAEESRDKWDAEKWLREFEQGLLSK